MTNLLVIEDNEENLKEAKSYFEKIEDKEGLKVFYARDYKTACDILAKEKIDGIISDLFFPEELGSGKFGLGEKLYDNMAEAFGYEPRISETFKKEISRHMGKDDEWENKNSLYLVTYELASLREYPEKLNEALKELSSLRRRSSKEQFEEVAPMIAMQHSHPLVRIVAKKLKKKELEESVTAEQYGAVLQGYMFESENNQPLGILIAEKAEKDKKPLVFITALHAGHDSAATPVAKYMQKILKIDAPIVETGGYGLNVRHYDISEEKTKFIKKEEDWKNAYSELKEQWKLK